LSRGLVGEDNAALLGALLVTKVQLAAMSRADMPAEERSPFYLYVDEFQNFATDSFATILSEARKYGLNLTVANQYTAQMAIEVKDAVFGNVGSILAFRMGADDARVMLKYFEPKFLEYDLVHMHNRHFVVSLTIEGEKVPAFSAISLNLPVIDGDHTDVIVSNSRAVYASSRAIVEQYVGQRYLGDARPGQPGEYGQPAKEAKPRPAAPRPQPARPVRTPEAAAVVPPSKTAPPAAPPVPSPMPDADVERKVNSLAQAVISNAMREPPAAQPAIAQAADEAVTELEDEPAKPKRKRTRRRKRKPADASVQSAGTAGTLADNGVVQLQ
jgi:hypothetical protein